MISEVMPDGAAARAGLESGDILLKFGEHVISGVDDLHRVLTAERAGQEVVLSVLRGAHIESRTIVPMADD
jgi:S1-C subfamily serine protease